MARIAIVVGVMLSTWCGPILGQTPKPDDRVSGPSSAARSTSRTVKIYMAFDRDSLDGAMKRISDEIGVAIVVERHDLQLAGITCGNSWGLNESELNVEQMLKKFLLKVNPNDKLAYVVRKSPLGIETVHIVTREGAAKRGEALFAEFSIGPPK